MKKYIVLLIVSLLILSCSRDWNNPFETDSDLSHPPAISNIELNGNHLELSLDYSYSDECTVLFERKRTTAFEPVTLLKLSASVFADTTLDMEQNYNLVYRLRVQKNGYTSDYSNEKPFTYVSSILNAPSELTCSSIELQGVRLNWTDNSGKETGYIIEKNVNGSGFAEAADLPANTTTFLDAISGMPDPPQSIIYRIRAYNNNLTSSWTEQNVIYSGLGAPTNLHVTNSNFWEFTISWTRNSTIATGYQIERKKDNGVFTILASVGAAVQTYTTELYENGDYTFRVKSVRNTDSSTYSNELSQQINIVMPTSGLIAYYPFNGNANDESGNGHNGTVIGAAITEDRFGVNGNAYGFDGVDDHVSIPSRPSLNPSTFTVCSWALFQFGNDDSECKGIVSKLNHNLPYSGYNLVTRPKAGVQKRFSLGAAFTNESNNIGPDIVTNNLYFPNTWYFVTASYDGERITMTVNGLEDFELLYTGNIAASTTDLYIGCEFITTDLDVFWKGKIDDVRIYNRALSEAEIKALYHEGGWTGAK